MQPATCLRVPSGIRQFEYPFIVERSLDYPAYVMDKDGEHIKAISLRREVVVPSVQGQGTVSEYLAALADVWAQSHSCDPTPTYLLVDFGVDAPPGLAVLIPSKAGWATLTALGAVEVPIPDARGTP